MESNDSENAKLMNLIMKELPNAIQHAREAGYEIHLTADEIVSKYEEHFMKVFAMPYGTTFDPYDYAEAVIYKVLKIKGKIKN